MRLKRIMIFFLLLIILGPAAVVAAPNEVANMAIQKETVSTFPVVIRIVWDDAGDPVRIVNDGFGDREVYFINAIEYENLTGKPYRFTISDEQGHEVSVTLAANEEGVRNIPPPQRPENFPFSFRLALIR